MVPRVRIPGRAKAKRRRDAALHKLRRTGDGPGGKANFHDGKSICAAGGEDFAEDAVGSGIQFQLEFPCDAAGLFHEGWIEKKCDAIDERAWGGGAGGGGRALAVRLVSG